MNPLERLCCFLGALNDAKIWYKIQMVSACRDNILVEIAIPGERWEVSFYIDGRAYIEKFISTGEVFDENELKKLFE